MTRKLHELAADQLRSYDAHHPGRIFDGPSPVNSQAEAYQLQMEVARLRLARGERLAGYKIGCVSEVVRAQLHMDRPLFGHVFSSEIHRSGVQLDAKAYAGLAIEGEFAVRLAKDVPDLAWLRAHETDVLASVFPVIELHNYVLRGRHPGVELIANNGIHAGAVLPVEEKAAGETAGLLDHPIAVFRNGEILGQSTSSAIPGGPFGSLCQLVEHLALYGIRLKANQTILTGSPLPLYRVHAGDAIEVRSALLGEVRARIGS